MRPFELCKPASLEEAFQMLTQNATFKAAGIDLLDLMKERVYTPARVVNLGGIAALRGITADASGAVQIGAGATLAELAAHAVVRKQLAGLADSAEDAATPQVRNRATMAGNLLQKPRCWYYRSADFVCSKRGGSECCALTGRNRYHAIFATGTCPVVHASNIAPALVALDAKVEIQGAKGKRTVALEQLYRVPAKATDAEHTLAADEVILSVQVPTTKALSAYVESREKESFDWAQVAAAVALTVDGGKIQGARIVLGAVAPIPWRVPKAEAALLGKEPGEAAFHAAAEAAFADATPLSENAYKIQVGKAILIDALTKAAARGGR